MTNAFLNFMWKKKKKAQAVVSTVWTDSLETSQIIMPTSPMARPLRVTDVFIHFYYHST